MTKIEEYRFNFENICKYMLVNGADVEAIEEEKANLNVLANTVEWFYGFIKDSDVDAKESMLNRVKNLRGDIVMLVDRIDRYIDTDSFTDYLSVVKMCVDIIG